MLVTCSAPDGQMQAEAADPEGCAEGMRISPAAERNTTSTMESTARRRMIAAMLDTPRW